MLLIGNGCFGELSIILRVPWYVYFSLLYLITFLPGLIAPEFPVSVILTGNSGAKENFAWPQYCYCTFYRSIHK